MRNEKTILILLSVIFLIGFLSAADFIPQGQIDMKGIYSMKNATNITTGYLNATGDICIVGGNCLRNISTTGGVGNASWNESMARDIFINKTSEPRLNVNSSVWWAGINTISGILGSGITNDLGWMTWVQIIPHFYFRNQTYTKSEIDNNLSLKLGITDQRYNETGLINSVNSSLSTINSSLTSQINTVNLSLSNRIDLIAVNSSINHTSIVFGLWNSTWDNRGLISSVNISLTGIWNSINTTGNIQSLGFYTKAQSDANNSLYLLLGDQRYNETNQIKSVNASLQNINTTTNARIDNVNGSLQTANSNIVLLNGSIISVNASLIAANSSLTGQIVDLNDRFVTANFTTNARIDIVNGSIVSVNTTTNSKINSINESLQSVNTSVNIQNLANGTVDAKTLGGFDAGFFMPNNKSVSGNFDFNGGWTLGGVSIIGGGVYAAIGYFYNITGLNVNFLNMNGSIFPNLDNQFNLGNSSMRWKNIYIGGDIYSNGTVYIDNGIDVRLFNDTNAITSVNNSIQSVNNSIANLTITETNVSLLYGQNTSDASFVPVKVTDGGALLISVANQPNIYINNTYSTGGGGGINLTTTTCDAGKKVSSINNATGNVICSTDLTGGNESFNQSLTDTLYSPIGSAGNASWNQSLANSLYAPNTTAGIQYLINGTGIYNQQGNLSWNQTLASSLYAPNTTAGIQYLVNNTGIYNQSNVAINTLNSTYGNTWINHTFTVFTLWNATWDNRGLISSANLSLTNIINSINTSSNIISLMNNTNLSLSSLGIFRRDNSQLAWTIFSQSGSLTIYSQPGSGNWGEVFTIRNQSVGIGTNTPTTTLEIVGDMNASGTYYVNNTVDVRLYNDTNKINSVNSTAYTINSSLTNTINSVNSSAYAINSSLTGTINAVNNSALHVGEQNRTILNYRNITEIGIFNDTGAINSVNSTFLAANTTTNSRIDSVNSSLGNVNTTLTGRINSVNASLQAVNTTLNIQNLYNNTASIIGNQSFNSKFRNYFNQQLNTTNSPTFVNGTFTGNVGIGTNSPAYPLVVNSSSGIQAQFSQNGNSSNGLFIAADSGSAHYNWLIGEQYNINKAFEITPSTVIGGTTFSTPALTILADTRNVGIGTTSPAGNLQVNGATDPYIALSNANNVKLVIGIPTTPRDFITGSSINDIVIRQSGGQKILFSTSATGSTNDLTLSAGNVGIGTTTPGYKLSINGGAGGTGAVVNVLRITGGQMTTANDTTGLLFVQRETQDDYGAFIRLITTQSSPGYLNPRLDIGIQNTNTNVQSDMGTKMSILGNGNVGIGTTTPASTLEVAGTGITLGGVTRTTWPGSGTGGGVNLSTTTCSGTDKVSAINNATGVVTCSTDQTGGVSGWEKKETNCVSSNVNTCSTLCSAGKKILGGGCYFLSGQTPAGWYPNNDTSWTCYSTTAGHLSAYSFCATV